MDYLNIVANIPLIVMLVFMLISGLTGLIRGLKKTVGSIVVIVVSVVFSLILTLILCNPELGIFDSLIEKLTAPLAEGMGFGDVNELEALSVVFTYYVSMLISPFVFTLLFFVFRLIFGIIMRIVVKKIPIMSKIPKVASKLGGMGAGLVVGFLVVMVVMMPFLGTVNVVNVAVTEMTEAISVENDDDGELRDVNVESLALAPSIDSAYETDEEDSEDIDLLSVLGSMTDKGAGKVMRVMGGDLLYKVTSNKTYHGKKVTLETEIAGMSHLLSSISSLGGDFSDMGGEENAFTKIADATEESPLIALLTAECVSSAAEKWSNGEEFMGVSSLGGDEQLIKPLMDAVLEVFSTTDDEHLSEDLRSIGAAFAVLGKYGLLDDAGDMESMLEKLNGTPVLSEMAAALHSNPRMSEVEKEVSSLGLRAFANVVGIPQEGDENYEEYKQMTKSIAESINNSVGMSKEEKREMVKSELVSAATDYGTDLEGEVADQITDRFIDEFGDRDDVTDEEIEAFIESYQNNMNT